MADGTQTPEVVVEKPAEAPAGGEAAPVQKPEGDKPAEKAAPAEGEKKGADAAPKSALEAAKAVMAKEQKPGSAEKPLDGKPLTDQAADVAKPAGGEDAPDPRFKDDPLYKEMSSKLRIGKVAQEKNETAIKVLEPKAKVHDDLVSFLSENNLGRDDFANGMSIMQAVRNDPAKAYELLRPVMERLESMVGVRLPDDLQAKVNAGQIDATTAHELARSRGSESLAREQTKRLQEKQQRDAEQRTRAEAEQSENAVMDTVVSTLNAAEIEWAKSDPDAAKLKPLVNDILMVAGVAKPPRNAEEAKALYTSSVQEAKRRAAGFTPTPQSKTGILPPGGAAVNTTPVPKSSLDAARAALGIRG